jgi:hypothetical protein
MLTLDTDLSCSLDREPYSTPKAYTTELDRVFDSNG